VSQHIGDLADLATNTFYEEEIGRWLDLLRARPDFVAHDLHPGYLSTRYASRLEGVTLIGVQHHHAHIAGVMAENGLQGPLLGVALDGTGYGTDGTVWGGEFLLADRHDFERLAHFRRYPLPGGERAIDEPWRMAVSVCHADGIDLGREFTLTGAGRATLGGAVGAPPDGTTSADTVGPSWVADGRARKIVSLIESGLNCPLTSSAGRMFDAAAALLGLCDTAGYEAQAAIRLETAAATAAAPATTGATAPAGFDPYPFEIHSGQEPWELDLGPTFAALLGDRRQSVCTGVIAARFHETVVTASAEVVRRLCGAVGVTDVVLSGGVFQNGLILSGLIRVLQAEGLSVHANSAVPCNDGGVSLGQAAVALARIARGATAGVHPQAGVGRREDPQCA
jgi:hydrogenase maturation protein HypF